MRPLPKILLIFLTIWAGGCANQSANIRKKSKTSDQSTDNNAQPNPLPDDVPLALISAFDLDDSPFMAQQVVVGMEAFFDTSVPTLNWKLPKNADYVEILRCWTGVDFSAAGTSTLSPRDVTLGSMTLLEKTAYFRSHKIWDVAQKQEAKCTLISDGATGTNFADSFAPSTDRTSPETMTFFYLLRTCVNPSRLTDQDKLSSRNCSQQVAVTGDITDFKSKYTDELREARREDALAQNAVEVHAAEIRYESLATVAAYDHCADVEKQRAIDTAVRNAFIQVVAAMAEVVIELKSIRETLEEGDSKGLKGILKSYFGMTKSTAGVTGKATVVMNWSQLSMALEGYLFTGPLQSIFSVASSMPRTCYEGYEHSTKLQKLSDRLPYLTGQALFYKYRVSVIEQGNAVLAGQKFEVPEE